jgi:NADPH-dependent curcumin reductase CurA
MTQTQIVYAKPPADGALPDPASTFNVVDTPFDTATSLEAGEVLIENQYLSIDPYHRFGLYDPAVTRSPFPVTEPETIISTHGVSRVVRSANPEYAVGDFVYSYVRWETFTVVDEPKLHYLQKGEDRYGSRPLSRSSRRARPDRIRRDHSNRTTQDR